MGFSCFVKGAVCFAFLPIKLLSPSPPKSSTIFPLYCYNTNNNLDMSCVSVGGSSFGHYATNYSYYNNASLVSENVCPVAIGQELTEGQMNSLDFLPAHASPTCHGFFEWEGEVKSTKCSCWGCGAEDVYHYRVEPIVEGTNCGAPLNAVSTPKLAQVKHMMYKQQNCLLTLEKELKEEKAKVLQLEVNNRELSSRITHLVLCHIGPTEKALKDIASSLLPFIFGCQSEEFRCKSSSPGDGSSGEAFVGGAGSGNSSSTSSVPSLVSNSPISRGLEWSIVPEEGENKRSMLSTFPVIHKAEVEEALSGGGGSAISSGGSEFGWFSPEQHTLSFKGGKL